MRRAGAASSPQADDLILPLLNRVCRSSCTRASCGRARGLAGAIRQGDDVSVGEEQQVGWADGRVLMRCWCVAQVAAGKTEVAALQVNEKLKATATWCPKRDAPSVLVSTIM